MLIELNGLNFRLDLLPGAEPAGLRARIVDEGFQRPQMDCPVSGADCVAGLVERYSGISPDAALRRRIARLVAKATAGDHGEFRVETGFEPHVLFLMN